MITRLSGKITYKDGESLEVDVNGVGYEVFVNEDTYRHAEINSDIVLFVYHAKTENTEDLYGFMNRKDSKVFRMLLSVSGIGPKTALSVFNAGNGDDILNAVSKADTSFFMQAKGIGNRAAQRIIVDLKSKVESVAEIDLTEKSYNSNVRDALRSLGFTREEISKALNSVPDDITTDEKIIEYILRNMGKHE